MSALAGVLLARLAALFVVSTLAAALIAGCGTTGEVTQSADGSPRATNLVFTAVNPNVGRARYELRCDPAGGAYERVQRGG